MPAHKEESTTVLAHAGPRATCPPVFTTAPSRSHAPITIVYWMSVCAWNPSTSPPMRPCPITALLRPNQEGHASRPEVMGLGDASPAANFRMPAGGQGGQEEGQDVNAHEEEMTAVAPESIHDVMHASA